MIEFFSGIGGMHYALKQMSSSASVKYNILKAFDFSTTANAVYHYNHPDSIHPSQKPIQNLSIKDLENANMWLMSPPCQPYTRQNETKKRDLNDKRSSALIHLCKLLDEISVPPTYFLLENVINFEVSDSCQHLLSTLRRRNYHFKMFKISPEQFGIPNTRPRIFILASLVKEIPDSNIMNCISRDNRNNDVNAKDKKSIPMKTIQDFLEPLNKNYDKGEQELLVSRDTLSSNGSWSLDIVKPSSNRSACFTHSYYRFMKGTGSIICFDDKLGKLMMGGHTNSLDNMINTTEQCVTGAMTNKKQKHSIDDTPSSKEANNGDNIVKHQAHETSSDEKYQQKKDWYIQYIGKLRYFSPKEIANLLGFPAEFKFPSNVSIKKQYSLVGNSLHVLTVAELLKLLFISRN